MQGSISIKMRKREKDNKIKNLGGGAAAEERAGARWDLLS